MKTTKKITKHKRQQTTKKHTHTHNTNKHKNKHMHIYKTGETTTQTRRYKKTTLKTQHITIKQERKNNEPIKQPNKETTHNNNQKQKQKH